MLPRFLKTFLFVLLLIVIPTLVLLYRNHPAGSNWNEWSLERGTSDSAWNPLSASGDDDDGLSPLHLEDHWNAGGAEPDYRYAKVVEAEKENIGTGTGGSKTMTVYRLGDTLVNQEELEAFRTWRQTYLSEGGAAKSADEDDLTRKDGEDRPILASAWSSDAAVQGGVIMPKLGNATAKAELGRASWKLLHLITMRFPEKPTEDERAALKSYFYLFR
ncbi:hypothetical protein QFC21_005361 [Naganishia friedmannii]|uniref:Uncharacterized protein n=1 Tax=Naganishia friedmannii TaxID=89922 RepID=A0ACC2VA59_9TREE|nr:hypothetical protein QFC21_005361 [Naganishia friedmannii]